MQPYTPTGPVRTGYQKKLFVGSKIPLTRVLGDIQSSLQTYRTDRKGFAGKRGCVLQGQRIIISIANRTAFNKFAEILQTSREMRVTSLAMFAGNVLDSQVNCTVSDACQVSRSAVSHVLLTALTTQRDTRILQNILLRPRPCEPFRPRSGKHS